MFSNKVINGLKANETKCKSYIEGSLAMCTSLVPAIGYDKAAEIAYKAYNSGKTVREVALEEKILDKSFIDELLNPSKMANINKK